MNKIIERYNRFAQQRSNSRIRRHPVLSTAVLSVFVFFMSAAGLVAVNAETVGPNDVKIVDIYQNGEVRSVPTRTETVGELLDKLDISLQEHDLVDPHRDFCHRRR